jgi:hypothetical protein
LLEIERDGGGAGARSHDPAGSDADFDALDSAASAARRDAATEERSQDHSQP